jgi:hypothetical protein
MQPPIVRAARTRGFTNRIQEYLGTYVPGRVTPNQMATMPQNYYMFNPNNINRQIIYQNFLTNNASLSLQEFKDQLNQLYRQNHLQPIPLSQEDEDYFNSLGLQDGDAPVQLRMNLPFPTVIPLYSDVDDPTMCTIHIVQRWGTMIRNSEFPTLPITTIHQIDRFILREYENVDPNDDIIMGAKRIRDLGSDELEWLLHCIENPGESPPANARLSILYDWRVYNTYAELAHAMGIPELQVANFEAAPFMASLLSPAARTEFDLRNEPFRPRRNPTRKCRK